MAYAMRHHDQITTASGLDVLAGFWLLISPFVLAFESNAGAMTNNVVLGIIVTLLALYRFFNPARHNWASWMNVVLGIWVLISPFVLGFGDLETAKTNNVAFGIVVIMLAGWSGLATMDINADEKRS